MIQADSSYVAMSLLQLEGNITYQELCFPTNHAPESSAISLVSLVKMSGSRQVASNLSTLARVVSSSLIPLSNCRCFVHFSFSYLVKSGHWRGQGYSSFTRRPSYDLRLPMAVALLLLRPHRLPHLPPPPHRRPDDTPSLSCRLRLAMQKRIVLMSRAAQEPQLKPKPYCPSEASRPLATKTLRISTNVALIFLGHFC